MSAYILFKVSTLQLNKQAIAGYFHYILPRFTYPDLSGLLNDWVANWKAELHTPFLWKLSSHKFDNNPHRVSSIFMPL